MSHSFTSRKRIRHNFGRLTSVTELPNLIEIQKKSYDAFLQINIPSDQRSDTGLQAVIKSVFPINDFSDAATLEFVKYEFDAPKYDVEECIQRDITFAAPLRATLRLIVWSVDEDTGAREIKSIKEQDVYLGDIPLMTEHGTFIINGTERVIVSQMHRSPGVFFEHDEGKTHSSGKYLYSARVIPYRGSWLDFEFDAKDLLYFRVDRRRKLHITSLLRAIGMETGEILDQFFETTTLAKTKRGWALPFNAELFLGQRVQVDIVDAKSGKVAIEAGTKINARTAKKAKEAGLEHYLPNEKELAELFISKDIIDEKTGEVLVKAATQVNNETLSLLDNLNMKEIPVLEVGMNSHPYLVYSMLADKNTTREESLIDVYKVMRPGEPPTPEAAETLFQGLFFDASRYDLSDVGRVKMSARLNLDIEESVGTLTKEDILAIVRTIIDLRDGNGEVDDIDHLGNRRVRSVGELLENQFRIGLLRMERAILERMGSVDVDTIMPHDLINAKPLSAVVREFFGSSQLSQFMDQTNPLSEITHKRRLSALGPGGLTRERAGFEVRDVHPTHYGRICPIETPEGPNIGLINSLATYARVNKYGFIETPYRKVVDGKLTDDVQYLSAIEEGRYTIAQSGEAVDKDNRYSDDLVSCRRKGEFVMADPKTVEFADVAPKQIVSVAASLIPFLENDDANRALMGSNMQRQAVPLVQVEAPLVGTGMESLVATDSGATLAAKADGLVDQVDATRIVIRSTTKRAENEAGTGVTIYNLRKFQRSNQSTCITQRPVVKVGDRVKKGDIIADGPSTDLGELALGRNVLVAFMPWNGYNFEDSILISERIVKEDVFTSIHIEEFEIMARDTKLGPEEITRDIPNISEENLRHLDEVGIVHIGAEVKAGDILVGKVTPKSESPITPEEKLLRAIFGEKAADVRDSSLRLPPGITGTVVEVRVFSRRGIEKDERAMAIERAEINRLTKDSNDERFIYENHIYGELKEILVGQKAMKAVESVKKGAAITEKALEEIPHAKWWQIGVSDEKATEQIEVLKKHHEEIIRNLQARLQDKIQKVQDGDDLPSGVLKMVKVFIAVKRKLQPGDKMAGRHGNKGVISKICPAEDMPYLADGTTVDIVLNPLGVPSRMNVGQIMETHLGWASANFGKQIRTLLDSLEKDNSEKTIENIRKGISSYYTRKEDTDEIKKMERTEVLELANNLKTGIPFATPVFDGAKQDDIEKLLEKSGLSTSGQSRLYDGRTGEQFDREVTVGYIYMLKLHHLVDDKIHARSIGPYSLVTQQPLGGKSHFGGQRFGEMECWALQAYGASYTLQEMLTVKSDDVAGRTKVYESIVKGDHTLESGIPESFHVMVKELRSLCLNVELISADNEDKTASPEDPESKLLKQAS
ncbi:MAG: DNA-directed RNA polymerase subunit beta [Hyphomicrobiales bacterium]|nr:DNA-directed RNA polymerase subunit beta [Hyphomicrobiales bacterium]